MCDQFKLRPNLFNLGDGHRKILKKARDFPKDFSIVYYFGSHEFSLVPLKKPVLRPWNCPEQDKFVKGHPNHLMKKTVPDDLQVAIQEAEDFLSQPEDIRLPMHMVPSDLDPQLEPPERTEQPAEDEEEEAYDEAGDIEMDSAAEDEGDVDMDNDTDEDTDKKKKRKLKKTSSSKSKKTKKSSSKDKEKKKESKKKSTSEKKKSSKSSSVKASPKDTQDDDKGKLKRRHSGSSPSVSDHGDDGESFVKVTKTEEESDVKQETLKSSSPQPPPTPKNTEMKVKEEHKPSVENVDHKKDEIKTENLSLEERLEKEIRWILVNCQFEEMTTKTVRKLLEKRLQMNLRPHKNVIKDVVTKVIQSMEKEDEENGQSEADKDIVVKQEGPDASTTDSKAHTSPKEEIESALKVQLESLKNDLDSAISDESKLLHALEQVEKIDSIPLNVLKESPLLPVLVKLRAHRNKDIAQHVARIAQIWNAGEAIPAPKPISDDELLLMKKKLERDSTTHEELLNTLHQLAEMPLEIAHLKRTGISRTVAKLRQHANDKVSIAASDLRHAWLQLVNRDNSDKFTERAQKLDAMYQVLEQKGEKDESVRRSQLNMLEELYKMPLSTQEIIDSKIGVAVSRLRKSSEEKIAHAAAKLRKKWKKEAEAEAAGAAD